jgi:hypothetical protein
VAEKTINQGKPASFDWWSCTAPHSSYHCIQFSKVAQARLALGQTAVLAWRHDRDKLDVEREWQNAALLSPAGTIPRQVRLSSRQEIAGDRERPDPVDLNSTV